MESPGVLDLATDYKTPSPVSQWQHAKPILVPERFFITHLRGRECMKNIRKVVHIIRFGEELGSDFHPPENVLTRNVCQQHAVKLSTRATPPIRCWVLRHWHHLFCLTPPHVIWFTLFFSQTVTKYLPSTGGVSKG